MGDKVAAYQWGLRLFVAPLEWLQSGRGALFPWAAVLIGVGVGVWFAQTDEPAAGSYSLAALLVVAGLVASWRGPAAESWWRRVKPARCSISRC